MAKTVQISEISAFVEPLPGRLAESGKNAEELVELALSSNLTDKVEFVRLIDSLAPEIVEVSVAIFSKGIQPVVLSKRRLSRTIISYRLEQGIIQCLAQLYNSCRVGVPSRLPVKTS